MYRLPIPSAPLARPGLTRRPLAGVPTKPIHTIVYSHDHLDHTGYAADLAPEAKIIAHDYANPGHPGPQVRRQLAASETFAGERTSHEIDGCYFELIYPTHPRRRQYRSLFPPQQNPVHGRYRRRRGWAIPR